MKILFIILLLLVGLIIFTLNYMSLKKNKKNLLESLMSCLTGEMHYMKRHCLHLESKLKQEQSLVSCMRELLEQYRQKQIILEAELKRKNVEVEQLSKLCLRKKLLPSSVFNAFRNLYKYNKENPDEGKRATREEWNALCSEVDCASVGFISKLREKYCYLSEEDIDFCCLLKLEFSYLEISYIWGCTRAAAYKHGYTILEKMGIDDHLNVKLKNILEEL